MQILAAANSPKKPVKGTDWFPESKKPRHRGLYEVKRPDNDEVFMARFKGKNWYDVQTNALLPPGTLSAWRGRDGRLSEARLAKRMQSVEKLPNRKDIRPLYRHWVSVRDKLRACSYYQIGQVLGARFSKSEKEEYRRLFIALTEEEVARVDKGAAAIFGRQTLVDVLGGY